MTATIPGYDVHALRAAEWPWTLSGEHTYLNHAGIGPLPERTLRATAEFNRKRAEPYRLSVPIQFGILSESRALAAQLVGGHSDEIALMVNTTYGINVAARCLELGQGDVVLTVDREFPANVYPWMALERDGVTYTRLPCVDGWPDEDALIEAIDRTPQLKVVTVSSVGFAHGVRLDLARIGAACRARGGVTFVVDAIQGLGVVPLDVHACQIDILACGAQKWLLSPWGTGFVWLRRELVRSLDPNPVGWMAPEGTDDFSTMLDYSIRWRDNARRFEVISLPFQDFVGFNESVGLLLQLGIANVHAHVDGLLDAGIAAAERLGLALTSPTDRARRAGILAVVPRGNATEACQRLNGAGVTHSLREGSVRLSPHAYNVPEEMERALTLLAS